MNIILWIFFGGLVGWLGSLVLNNVTRSQGTKLIASGVIGGVIGGFIVNTIGHAAINNFNIYSIMAAAIGGIAVVGLYRYSPCYKK